MVKFYLKLVFVVLKNIDKFFRAVKIVFVLKSVYHDWQWMTSWLKAGESAIAIQRLIQIHKKKLHGQ